MARLKHGAFLKKGAENPKAQGCASGEASQDDAAKMLKVSRRNL